MTKGVAVFCICMWLSVFNYWSGYTSGKRDAMHNYWTGYKNGRRDTKRQREV